ncbi:MAG: hypothetical protein IJ160_00855 [Muribaculaceae bacterium]|nr:hypothetical protein [Muribaculaceae bacterium]
MILFIFINQLAQWGLGFMIPAAIITYVTYMVKESSLTDDDLGGMFVSALIPIVGLIIYFAQRDKAQTFASVCLTCAIAGFAVNWMIILMAI